MLFSDEEIISFLLGDAPPELAERIRAQLPSDSELLDRLSILAKIAGAYGFAGCNA